MDHTSIKPESQTPGSPTPDAQTPADLLAPDPTAAPVIEVRDIVTRFGQQAVHDGVSFSIGPGQLVALIGGSGTGKSVLLREMIGLHKPSGGQACLLGTDMWASPDAARQAVRRRFGMMFQDGALFSSLTVAQNVAVPLREHTTLPEDTVNELVALRLAQAGLPPGSGSKMPSELSGGMRKRAALARALALEPELLFLDEPTSGLDPITARAFDQLVRSLVDDLGITVMLITHDLDSLMGVVDRVIVLSRGRVLADGPVQQVMAVDDAWVQEYFAQRQVVGAGADTGAGTAPGAHEETPGRSQVSSPPRGATTALPSSGGALKTGERIHGS